MTNNNSASQNGLVLAKRGIKTTNINIPLPPLSPNKSKNTVNHAYPKGHAQPYLRLFL